MGIISVDVLHDVAEAIVEREERQGVHVTPHLHISKEMADGPGLRRLTSLYFAQADSLSLLRIIGNSQAPPHAWISFSGDGATGLTATAGMYQHLLVKGPKYEWGGPFVVPSDDGITFGTRYTIPRDIISDDRDSIREAAHFISQMIGLVGQIARMLGDDIVPRYGGRLLQDVSADRSHFYSCVAMP